MKGGHTSVGASRRSDSQDLVTKGRDSHELCREGVSRKYEEYKGLCFYNGDCTLVVDV